VREVRGSGRPLYELDEETLARLAVDLIVTQAVCDVCAVSYEDVRAVADRLPTRPAVISLDPQTLPEVIADVAKLGAVTEAEGAGECLTADLEQRVASVRAAVAGAERPRVLALEWLDPPFAGGHWIPEMIEIAGGTDPIGEPGAKSRTVAWDDLEAANGDIVVAMPCGWDAAQARREALERRAELERLGAERIVAVDAAASFSRPGPRLIVGTELLAHLFHPGRVDPPAGVDFELVELERATAR
jgi:iron complex transport system substrate-binding protein